MKLEAPDWISEEAQGEFARVVDALGDAIKPQHLSLLADYAQCYADIKELTIRVREEGTTILNLESGVLKQNPNASLLQSKLQLMRQLRCSLGFNVDVGKTNDAGKSLRDLL